MIGWYLRVFLVSSTLLLFTWQSSFAETPAGLRDQINLLSARVGALEKQWALLEAKNQTPSTPNPVQLLENRLAAQENLTASTPAGLFGDPFWKENKFKGFVDVSYVYNFNEPNDLINTLRSFDATANAFNVQSVWLQLERPADPIGYLVAIEYGLSALLANGLDHAADNEPPVLEMAYVEWKPPLKSKDHAFSIIGGRFQSMVGWESLNSTENWNFSPGFLDLMNAPNILVGTRAHYTYREQVEIYAGVNNGQDLNTDNNQAKTLEGGIGYTPFPRLHVLVDGLYGAEQPMKSGNHSGLLDVQAEYTPVEKLTLRFDYQYFSEGNAVSQDSDAMARGYAGYVRYQWRKWYALVSRLEFFDDPSGARSGTPQNLWEITVTNEFKFFENLLMRLEYRHDHSDKNIFGKSDTFVDTQDTLALEAIYPF